MHNEVDKLLKDKDSQVLLKKELHTESFYVFISSLNSIKQHIFKVVYILSAKQMQ